jgi:hypothetical protein
LVLFANLPHVVVGNSTIVETGRGQEGIGDITLEAGYRITCTYSVLTFLFSVE